MISILATQSIMEVIIDYMALNFIRENAMMHKPPVHLAVASKSLPMIKCGSTFKYRRHQMGDLSVIWRPCAECQ